MNRMKMIQSMISASVTMSDTLWGMFPNYVRGNYKLNRKIYELVMRHVPASRELLNKRIDDEQFFLDTLEETGSTKEAMYRLMVELGVAQDDANHLLCRLNPEQAN